MLYAETEHRNKKTISSKTEYIINLIDLIDSYLGYYEKNTDITGILYIVPHIPSYKQKSESDVSHLR